MTEDVLFFHPHGEGWRVHRLPHRSSPDGVKKLYRRNRNYKETAQRKQLIKPCANLLLYNLLSYTRLMHTTHIF